MPHLYGIPLARLVHDVLNPIATIKANLSFLEGSLAGEAREAASEAAAETRRAERMLRDLQDLDRLARREHPVARVDGSLAEVARAAADEVSPTARLRRVAIVIEGDARAALDPALARRLVVNLLAVALRYGPDGQPVLVRIDAPRGRPRLAVRDRGPAVAEGERATLRPEDARRAPPRPGAALGLTFARMAARALGASVGVRASAEGCASIVRWPPAAA